ncbi:MAG: hypothetical protein IPM79_31145 [Polyangiaceae bacterium]|nr:hypothetical protein [Polyangiaceae bacterium]
MVGCAATREPHHHPPGAVPALLHCLQHGRILDLVHGARVLGHRDRDRVDCQPNGDGSSRANGERPGPVERGELCADGERSSVRERPGRHVVEPLV